MKPFLLTFVLLFVCSVGVDAQTSVPKAVAVWYGDLIGLYQGLFADLDQAEEAPALVEAFHKALAREAKIRLVARFYELAKRYPDFFRNSSDGESDWTPPVDWNRIQETYSVALGRFGNVMKKVFSFERGHPEVTAALSEFASRIGPMIYE